MTEPLPETDIAGDRGERSSWTSSKGKLCLPQTEGDDVEIRLERCALGRLRNAYPVGATDIEIDVVGAATDALSRVLRETADTILAQDRDCRRVVYAVQRGSDEGPGSSLEAKAAFDAGFRFVVDVDIEFEELSLFVAEPTWVTDIDPELDWVPGT